MPPGLNDAVLHALAVRHEDRFQNIQEFTDALAKGIKKNRYEGMKKHPQVDLDDIYITREEVISMLNFDLMDTVAGKQIFEEGVEKGILKNAKSMVIEALTERFVVVPSGLRESVYSVGHHKELKELLRYAIRSPHIEDFEKILSKVLSASKQTGQG